MYIMFETSPIYRQQNVFDTNTMNICQNFETDDDLNVFTGIIDILFAETEDDVIEENFINVGNIEFHAYNLNGFDLNFDKNYYNLCRLFDYMDDEGVDQVTYYDIFLKAYDLLAKKLDESWNDIWFDNDKYFITLDRLYIDEKYRKKGIATYALNNLNFILNTYYNINPIIITGICKPDDNTQEMLKIQIDTLRKVGFTIYRNNNKDTCFYNLILS